MNDNKKIIFHICTKIEWKKAQAVGRYRGKDFAKDDFIHCSTPQQIERVAKCLFKGRKDLVLLEIDSERVNAEIKYEGSLELYPHIYGPLNLGAVIRVRDFYID